MAQQRPGIDRSESIEDLHHLRLRALLDEQVDEMGQGLSAVQGEVNALGNDHAGDFHRVESRLERI